MSFESLFLRAITPFRFPGLQQRNRLPRDQKGVLILGWYGMETTGDKAILASILQNERLRDCRVYQASYDVAYSRETLREIGCEHVQVVPNDMASFASVLPHVDVVLIGGGPLMQGREMRVWHKRLLLAKQLGKRIMVYGCGVGPIRKKKDQWAILKILQLADEIHLRDHVSAETAQGLGNLARPLVVTADPVMNFRYDRAHSSSPCDALNIGISIRSLPRSYFSAARTQKTLEQVRQEYEACFVQAIDHFCEKPDVRICLVPMQLHEGDDDRILLRRIRGQVSNPNHVKIIEGYGSPAELIQHFDGFDFFIGMRFHSVVFSYVSGTPAVGIDYDMEQGKVTGVMSLMQSAAYTINLRDLTADRLISTVERGLAQRDALRKQIQTRLATIQHQERQNAEALNRLLQAA